MRKGLDGKEAEDDVSSVAFMTHYIGFRAESVLRISEGIVLIVFLVSPEPIAFPSHAPRFLTAVPPPRAAAPPAHTAIPGTITTCVKSRFVLTFPCVCPEPV
eukprot:COSAG06_NODE_32203_length_509_cov_8.968293_2_plen_101_part_01